MIQNARSMKNATAWFENLNGDYEICRDTRRFVVQKFKQNTRRVQDSNNYLFVTERVHTAKSEKFVR